jgi:hypothetical protein
MNTLSSTSDGNAGIECSLDSNITIQAVMEGSLSATGGSH